jgi:mRNA export factor
METLRERPCTSMMRRYYRVCGPRYVGVVFVHTKEVWLKIRQDGTKLASGGADKQAKLYDISTGQSSQVAAHDAPVKCVRFIQAPQTNAEMLVTGSWDKKLKYWDLRTPNPVATLDMQERVYTLDVAQGLMVVGTAERYINIVNLSNPTVLFKTMQSPLKWQTRVITCFPDATGFAIGSIEGRCAIQYVDDKNSGYEPPICVRQY